MIGPSKASENLQPRSALLLDQHETNDKSKNKKRHAGSELAAAVKLAQ